MIFLKNFWQNNLVPTLQIRLISFNFFLAIIFLISSVILLLVFRQKLPPQVPLFYSLIWGESQLSPSSWLWMLPAGQFMVLILNLLLAAIVHPKEEVLEYFMAFATTCFNLLTLITLFKIIYLVTG